MDIEATWSQPVRMKRGPRGGLIYTLDLEKIPRVPGVYIFGRKHGTCATPIYIGESLSLHWRAKKHLDSVPLMRAIENAPNGDRFFMYCTVKAGTRDKAKKHIKIVERALILHAQSDGHELVNKQGTKLPVVAIHFTGNRTSEAIAPRSVLIKRALARFA